MSIIYISLDQALKTHSLTIEVSGGGNKSILNTNQLISVLQNMRNDDWYPKFEDKLTHLVFSVCKFHGFADGNKRIAIALGAQFLLLNGYVFISGKFIRFMENIIYHVAAGNITKDLLKEIIYALLSGVEENEELKIKIWHAIRNDDS